MNVEQAREVLAEAFPQNPEQIEDYIQDAEDQEGSSYWASVVVTPQRLVHDFKLFLEALEIDAQSPSPGSGDGKGGASDG